MVMVRARGFKREALTLTLTLIRLSLKLERGGLRPRRLMPGYGIRHYGITALRYYGITALRHYRCKANTSWVHSCRYGDQFMLGFGE